MNSWLSLSEKLAETIQPAAMLFLRIWVAQEFISAGWIKLAGGWSAPDWFAGLGFPFPLSWLPADLNWISAGLAEVTLGALLLVGLAGRFAALGLLFVTWVAVYSVHFDLGWAGWNQIETEDGQGFKVPLMLAVMLFSLFCSGMGRWSVDAWWYLRRKQAS